MFRIDVFSTILFKALLIIQRASSILQGKGFGTSSVDKEVSSAAKFLPNNPTLIVDVGANKGEYTAALRKRFKEVEIHLFEPSRTNYEILRRRFNQDFRISINNFGLSETKGEMTLYSDKSGSGMASLARRRLDHFGIDFNQSEKVSISTFYEYWNTVLNRQSIDFIKIDIEGFELSALRGFGESINHCKLIQFEFGGCNIDTRTYFQDFWYFFTNKSFTLWRITPIGPIKIDKYSEFDEVFSTTNYLAFNERL